MDNKSLEEIEQLYKNPETYHIAMSRDFYLKDQMQREQDAYDEGFTIGLLEGYQEGLELGKLLRWKETIMRMVQYDNPIEKMAKVFNVSIEKIEEFIKTK